VWAIARSSQVRHLRRRQPCRHLSGVSRSILFQGERQVDPMETRCQASANLLP
jgi:hypothetical protein